MIHLQFGGSTAERTLQCPGWVNASKNIKPRPAGAAALEGSMHHAVQEKCRLTDTLPEEHVGLIYEEDGKSQTFTEDDVDLAKIAYAAADAILDAHDVEEIYVEPFVQWVEGKRGGSIDLLGVSRDGKVAVLIDYKFGRVQVDASKAQMPFYAVCAKKDPQFAALLKDVETFHCVIIQPRGAGGTHSMTRVELADFEVKMDQAIRIASGGTAARHVGSHCLYCPAAPYCSEKRYQAVEATLLDPKDHSALSNAADWLVEVEAWVKAVKEEMHHQLSRGVRVDGWKLVAKQGKRGWEDEAALLAAARRAGLLKTLRKTSILSPAQAEKALKGRKFDLSAHIKPGSVGTTIATSDDAREPVIVTDIVGALATLMDQKQDQ